MVAVPSAFHPTRSVVRPRGSTGSSRFKLPEVKKQTIDWAQALQNAANQFQVLGGTAGEVLSRIAGGIAAVGTGIQAIAAGGIGGILSGGASILGSVVGLIGGLFGGGRTTSKTPQEEAAAVAQRQADEAQRVSAGVDRANAGLAMIDFNTIGTTAAQSGAIFSDVFWATVKEKGLIGGLEALMAVFEKLPAEIIQSGALRAGRGALRARPERSGPARATEHHRAGSDVLRPGRQPDAHAAGGTWASRPRSAPRCSS